MEATVNYAHTHFTRDGVLAELTRASSYPIRRTYLKAHLGRYVQVRRADLDAFLKERGAEEYRYILHESHERGFGRVVSIEPVRAADAWVLGEGDIHLWRASGDTLYKVVPRGRGVLDDGYCTVKRCVGALDHVIWNGPADVGFARKIAERDERESRGVE